MLSEPSELELMHGLLMRSRVHRNSRPDSPSTRLRRVGPSGIARNVDSPKTEVQKGMKSRDLPVTKRQCTAQGPSIRPLSQMISTPSPVVQRSWKILRSRLAISIQAAVTSVWLNKFMCDLQAAKQTRPSRVARVRLTLMPNSKLPNSFKHPQLPKLNAPLIPKASSSTCVANTSHSPARFPRTLVPDIFGLTDEDDDNSSRLSYTDEELGGWIDEKTLIAPNELEDTRY